MMRHFNSIYVTITRAIEVDVGNEEDSTVMEVGYGVEVSGTYDSGYDPLCSGPDHPAYSDPGSGSELEIHRAEAIEYTSFLDNEEKERAIRLGLLPLGTIVLSEAEIEAVREQVETEILEQIKDEYEAAMEAKGDAMREEVTR